MRRHRRRRLFDPLGILVDDVGIDEVEESLNDAQNPREHFDLKGVHKVAAVLKRIINA